MIESMNLPEIAMGTGGLHGEDGIHLIRKGLEFGYRLIDTATAYGNEETVGKAIKSEKKVYPDIKIITKIAGKDHGYESTCLAVKNSLKRLCLEQVDFILIHWPLPMKGLFLDTYKALIEMRRKGYIDKIGVSNFNQEHLLQIEKQFDEFPVINQVEMHPFYQQSKLRAFHKKNGIQTLAWSPLFKKEHDILLHPALVGIAARYSASVAQIILVWHKLVGSVPVVKTRSIKHMRENFEAMKIILLKEDLQKISLLDADMKRGGDPSTYEE